MPERPTTWLLSIPDLMVRPEAPLQGVRAKRFLRAQLLRVSEPGRGQALFLVVLVPVSLCPISLLRIGD